MHELFVKDLFVHFSDVENFVDKLIKFYQCQISANKERFQRMINELLEKLPALEHVSESDLYVLRTEKNLIVLMKQFSFVFLYYLLLIHWPHIEKLNSFARIKTFFQFFQGLIKHNVLKKLKAVTDRSKFEFSTNMRNYLTLNK